MPRRLPPTAEPLQRPSRALIGGIAAFMLVFGLAGWAWRGNREGLFVAPGDHMAVAADPHGGDASAPIETMVDRLSTRLERQPDDAEGWALLGRTYSVLGRAAEAVGAYRKLVALRPKDAQALADLADALATVNGRSLEGEAAKLVAEAVAIEPQNVKALALAGTVAFNRRDFQAAAQSWQRAIDKAEPDTDFARQLQLSLAEARGRHDTPTPTATASAPGAAVAGRVTLAPGLLGRVAPDDSVFIFARAVDGPRMPLAILKRRAAELPFDFRLDDSMAMTPQTRLSSARQVLVGARISKNGSATTQPGDLQGLSAAANVGTSDLRIEINEPLR